MAQAFKNYISTSVGTTAVSTYTVPTATSSVLMGVNIANRHTAQITVSVYITSGGSDCYIVKDAPIPAGSALSVLDGKIVLEAADVLKIISDTASSADIIVSTLEQS